MEPLVADVRALCYTPEECARALRVGRSKIYELLARGPDKGGLRGIHIDGSRRVLVSDLDAYLRRIAAGSHEVTQEAKGPAR